VTHGFTGVTESEGMEEFMLEERASGVSSRILNSVIRESNHTVGRQRRTEEKPPVSLIRNCIKREGTSCCRYNRDLDAIGRRGRSKQELRRPWNGAELRIEIIYRVLSIL
jgi:hypothetical protein